MKVHEIAKQYGVSVPTVGKWRSRFVAQRLAGLLEGRRPRSGKKYEEDMERAVLSRIATTDATTREIAKALRIGQSTVVRIKMRAAYLR